MRTRRPVLLSLIALCVVGATLGVVTGSAFAAVPTTSNVSFSNVGVSTATLSAAIDPEGSATTYKFEYGPTSGYGSSTSTVTLAGGTEGVGVQAQLEGLQQGTPYHFRLVATNESGPSASTDATFTTFEPAFLGLPDNRGYEKVSANNNADGNVYFPIPVQMTSRAGARGLRNEQPFVAAEDGNALVYMGYPPEIGGTGHVAANGGDQYLARRYAGGGWNATNITPASEQDEDEGIYQGFSKDLSAGFLVSNKTKPLAAGAPAGGFQVPYLRDFASESYTPLLTVTPPHRGINEFHATGIVPNSLFGAEPQYVGSSADLKHVLWMANDALTANAVDGGEEENNLYDTHEGQLTLVNVLPDGSSEPSAIFGGPTPAPYTFEEGIPPFSHAISEDGSRIFWTDLNNGNLYMRESGTTTVQVDASVGGGGQFWTASADGSKVLFTKGGDLYEYDVNGGRTTDLTPNGEVQGVVGATDDLSYIYFVANAALAPGSAQQTCGAEEGRCNLYVLHGGDPPKFIGALSHRDNETFPTSFYELAGDWQAGLGSKEAGITPDGRHLVFVSVEPLTGYANDGAAEAYIYDYESGELHCASCNPTGEPPRGRIGRKVTSAWLPISHMNDYTPRWISADGNRVFFDSLDALVPQDTNGWNDVYEWERDGSGSCTTPSGCIYLLSGGTSAEGAYLLDASANGNDVFLATRAQLSPEDQNENVDAYDLRVGAATPAVVPQCTGTGCQGVPSAPPVFSTPSSVTYNGVGNFASPAKSAPKARKPKSRGRKRKTPAKHSRKAHKAGRRAHRQTNGNGRGK